FYPNVAHRQKRVSAQTFRWRSVYVQYGVDGSPHDGNRHAGLGSAGWLGMLRVLRRLCRLWLRPWLWLRLWRLRWLGRVWRLGRWLWRLGRVWWLGWGMGWSLCRWLRRRGLHSHSFLLRAGDRIQHTVQSDEYHALNVLQPRLRRGYNSRDDHCPFAGESQAHRRWQAHTLRIRHAPVCFSAPDAGPGLSLHLQGGNGS